MSFSKFDLEKFDGKMSFTAWKMYMYGVLVQSNLKKALAGKAKKPATMSEEEWEDLDEKALTAIQLMLAKNVLLKVTQEKTAAGLWLKLEQLYMTKSLANKIQLKERLFTLRMCEGSDLQTHLDEFNAIAMDLENLDEKVKDEDLAILLICSLPPSFKNFRDIMLYGSRDSLTLEEVVTNLMSKEKYDQGAKGSADKSEGLVARGRNFGKGDSSNRTPRSKSRAKDKTNAKCHYCKKTGHFMADCFKLKNKQDREAKEKGKSASGEADVVRESEEGDIILSAQDNQRSREEWIMDSGCTFHITPHREWFTTLDESASGVVLMGNDTKCDIKGIGSVRIRSHDGCTFTLADVRFVPQVERNLISLGTLEKRGYRFSAENGIMKVSTGSRTLLKADRVGCLYVLQGSTIIGDLALATTSSNLGDSEKAKLWHMRLGHMSEKGLKLLAKKGAFKDLDVLELDFCEHCVFGKQTRLSFATSTNRAKAPLDYIHSDLWGPSQEPSVSGKRYFMSLIDDFSRKAWVYFIVHKSEALQVFKDWKTLVEKQTDRKVKKLRTDRGMEFCSREFDAFCSANGIARHKTMPYSPQQNGVAERINRTLLERSRCMLSNAKLWDKRYLWAEAVSTACYLINRSPHSAIDFACPEEVFSGKAVDYSNLHVFGCNAYAHVNDGKLAPRAIKCLFIGYSLESKGFRLWDVTNRKLVLSRDVTFDELALLPSKQELAIAPTPHSEEQSTSSDSAQLEDNIQPPENSSEGGDQQEVLDEPTLPTSAEDTSLAKTRPRREIKKPSRYTEDFVTAFALSIAQEIDSADEPENFREATSCSSCSNPKISPFRVCTTGVLPP